MKKLFKNCPHEGRKNCEGCSLLRDCKKRKLKRNLREIRWGRVTVTFCLLVAIISIIIVFGSSKTQDNEIFCNVEKTITTELKKSEVKAKTITLKAVQTIEPKATKEPIIKKKPQATKNPIVKKKPKATKKPKVTRKPKVVAKKETMTNFVSDYEKKLMEKVVYAESRGEPYKGQVAVAAVILNRYEFNKGNASIEEIITAKWQFANIKGITENDLKAYPDCKRAVEEALKGEDPTRAKFKNGARYFFDPEGVKGYQKKIRQGIEYFEIGGHRFHNDFNE